MEAKKFPFIIETAEKTIYNESYSKRYAKKIVDASAYTIPFNVEN